ncbi:MAG: DUF309 domain-containing protein [Polyangiales bacterium]
MMKMPTLRWSDEQHQGLAKALTLMKTWRFHAAHEEFEALWRGATSRERTCLHGLTQVAASLHQLTLGRGAASVRTWQRARPKLEGLALDDFMTRMDALHQVLGLRADAPRFFDPGTLREHASPVIEAFVL